jgi:hypothetical protein
VSKKPDEVSLATLRSGAAVEMFDAALAKVLRNIADVNTPATAERAVTLTVKFHPGEERDEASYSVHVVPKLAADKPATGNMFVGRRGTRVVAVANDPRQPDMFDPEAGASVTPLSAVAQGAKEEEK